MVGHCQNSLLIRLSYLLYWVYIRAFLGVKTDHRVDLRQLWWFRARFNGSKTMSKPRERIPLGNHLLALISDSRECRWNMYQIGNAEPLAETGSSKYYINLDY
jgi:hypothetical protein